MNEADFIAKGFVKRENGEWYKPTRRQLLDSIKDPSLRSSVEKMMASETRPARRTVVTGKRIKQDAKPLLNKLEQDWLAHLRAEQPLGRWRGQAMRFKLANGAWYRPDIVGWNEGRLVCYECKGPKQMKNVDRGILTVKFAAAMWPEVTWVLVWKHDGQWRKQLVLP